MQDRPVHTPKDKQKLLTIQQQLAQGRAELRRLFERQRKPSRYLTGHSALMDQIITACLHLLDPAATSTISILALGGYGRRELFPHSDIDLLILLPDTPSDHDLDLAEALVRTLWDLGLKVGHACRTREQTVALAADDHTITTALLDLRLITGNRALAVTLKRRFRQAICRHQAATFIEAKLQERETRHARFGDSRLFLEPNIKETKGGLRDLHSLYWMARYAYGVSSVRGLVRRGLLTEQEAHAFTVAQFFLARIRIWLHLITGRAEDRLSFDLQPLICQQMGYGAHADDASPNAPVERFMKRYFRTAHTIGTLTRVFCALLEEEHKRQPHIALQRLQERADTTEGFVLLGHRLNFDISSDVTHNPIRMVQLFREAQRAGVDIHPRALQTISRSLHSVSDRLAQSPEAYPLFIEMLLSHKQAEITLRLLNEAGLLGALIPEFGQIVGQMQYDRYHRYTVDEHTLRAIGIFHAIEQGEPVDELPLACEVAKHITSRHVVLLALLCHDIAKGSGGDHEARGAPIAAAIATRMGFNAVEAADTAWLVEHQMLLANHALKRDLSDPRTISDVVMHLHSLERLRLLLLLTVCDMRAVGHGVWNRWKGALLRDLYQRLLVALGATPPRQNALPSTSFSPDDQALLLALTHHPEEWRNDLLSGAPAAFWQGCTQTQQHRMADATLTHWRTPDRVWFDYEIDRFEGVTHLMVIASHCPALISQMAGCLSMCGASIIRAQSLAMPRSSTVLLLDIQTIQSQAFDDEARLAKCHTLLENVIAGEASITLPLHPHPPSCAAALQITFDNHSSDHYTLIEITGTDRIGLLYQLCHALDALRLTIATAHITTYGTKAVDVFYVRDRFGLKIERPALLHHIRKSLIATLGSAP